jgi:hypothetical protein
MRLRIFAILVLPLLPLPSAFGQTPDAKGIEFFETKIRPVLVDHCYQCHSGEAEKNKKLRGGLRLDTRAGALKGGESGPALVPGKTKEGHLLKALRYDGEVKMPPKKMLAAEVIADFVKWIEMGAPDPRDGAAPRVAKKTIDIVAGQKFWSFERLASPAVPAVKNESWAKTPLDRFILAKLDAKGLKPNDAASREKLVRRAFFDLWGLPPTPAQIGEFVHDPAPDAYAKLIDRLLAGPAYGERWGRHWLDVVRFAESGGYEFDGDRAGAYHYRDWVIKALNADMPYDEFVRLQIAGDLLNPGDFAAATATGFLVAGPYPGQTTSKTLQLIRYNHLDDMVSTLGSGMLGLTIGCARCHDHKYDPIPQSDYYALIANLGRVDSLAAKLDPRPEIHRKAKAEFDVAHTPLVAAREMFEKVELPARVADWYATASSAPVPHWSVLDPVDFKGKGPLQKLTDGSIKPLGKIEKSETITIVAQTHQKGITGFRLEALADKDLPKSGPGLEANGSFTLTELSVQAAPLGGKGKSTPVKLRPVAASSEAKDQPLAAAVDGDAKTGWAIEPSGLGQNQAAHFEIVGDLGNAAGLQLTIVLKFDGKSHAIGRPRVAISTRNEPRDLAGPSELQHAHEATLVLRAADGKLNPANQPLVSRWYRRLDADYDALHKTVEEHARKTPTPNLVSAFVATGNRGGDVHFLVRGEVERKGTKAEPGYLQVLLRPGSKLASDPRIALANWITDIDTGAGPLLARVIVNRLWQHHLGRGIVATPNDFGAQGDWPTHPELLNYLAQELVQGGWKLKAVHKQIMLSAVYMQTGELRSEAANIDPNNNLWWRRPPRRLEAEIVRDNVLAVGGGLDTAPFGPGTLDVNSPRRSVYLTVKRSQPVPMLQMLDAPEAIQSVGERSRTTVPTQSLAFMNSPLVRKQAESLAKTLKSQAAENLADAIEQGYLATLGRRPTDAERRRVTAFIEQQTASYGPTGRDQALGDFCQVLMCLNEFVYID